jgi:hypothetical protein
LFTSRLRDLTTRNMGRREFSVQAYENGSTKVTPLPFKVGVFVSFVHGVFLLRSTLMVSGGASELGHGFAVLLIARSWA